MNVRMPSGWLDIGAGNGASGIVREGEDGVTHRYRRLTGEMVVAPPATGKNDPLTPSQSTLDARPVRSGRPRLPVYGTDAARIEARRRTWRESKRRRRDRTSELFVRTGGSPICDNEQVGSSDTSTNRMPSTPFRSLTLLSGVVASRGQD